MLLQATRYYHGTDAELGVGDEIVPGDSCGQANWPGMDVGFAVWMHDSPEWAARYGQHVYEVEPLDAVTNFSEEAGHVDEMESARQWEYITPRVRVVREVGL